MNYKDIIEDMCMDCNAYPCYALRSNDHCYSYSFLNKHFEKAEKYRWHDLRKNPEDLPSECGFYIACVEHPKNHTRSTREITLYNICNGHYIWKRNNRFIEDGSVISWKHIEPFEENEVKE